jgi:hypothetical protein
MDNTCVKVVVGIISRSKNYFFGQNLPKIREFCCKKKKKPSCIPLSITTKKQQQKQKQNPKLKPKNF